MSQDELKFSVNFSTKLNTEELKVFEIDNNLLEQFQEYKDTKLQIKGPKNGDSVLCSKDKTFEIKKVESSNTSLLVPDSFFKHESQENRSVNAIANISNYYELVPTLPRLKFLRSLLQQCPYTESECDSEMELDNEMSKVRSRKMYTWNELNQMVQASPKELKQSLDEQGAIEVNGYWRMVDKQYLNRTFELILLLCQEHGWDLSSVPINETVKELSEQFDPLVLRHCFRVFGTQTSDSNHCKFSHSEISLFRAHQLFDMHRKWKVKNFQSSWHEMLENDFENYNSSNDINLPSIDLLLKDGVCVIQNNQQTISSQERMLQYVNKENLPQDPRKRFKELFAIKSTWTEEEMTPFIRDIVTSNTSEEKLLLKYSRVIRSGKQRLYTSRQ